MFRCIVGLLSPSLMGCDLKANPPLVQRTGRSRRRATLATTVGELAFRIDVPLECLLCYET